jgi:hypothetical protein
MNFYKGGTASQKARYQNLNGFIFKTKNMNNYKCEILTDSLNTFGDRITTFKVTYPRIIHAEMLRHKMFSRNVASSRAIPFKKMVKDVEENPFIPLAWQKDHKGMQGTEYITNVEHLKVIEQDWLEARNNSVKYAKRLAEGFPNNMEDDKDTYQDCVTKQLCNRLLEPFVWTTELITTSEKGLQNFFELRCPKYLYDYEDEPIYFESKKDWVNYYNESQGYVKGNPRFTYIEDLTNLEWLQINQSEAEIHIQAIAEMMWDAYNESKPKQLEAGEYHLPFIEIEED